MRFTMELHELKAMCMDMAALGAARFVRDAAPARDEISQREAYRLFTEPRVKRWVAQGLARATRNGEGPNAKKYYSRTELLALNGAERLNAMIDR